MNIGSYIKRYSKESLLVGVLNLFVVLPGYWFGGSFLSLVRYVYYIFLIIT